MAFRTGVLKSLCNLMFRIGVTILCLPWQKKNILSKIGFELAKYLILGKNGFGLAKCFILGKIGFGLAKYFHSRQNWISGIKTLSQEARQ